MPTFISPAGNFEIWDVKPDGYLTEDEWQAKQPVIAPVMNPADKIKAEIAALEMQQTDRRIREAALTEEGRAWLQNLEDQIAAKRAELAGLS